MDNNLYTDVELKDLDQNTLINHCLELQAKYRNVVAENLKLKESLEDLHARFSKLENVVEEMRTGQANNNDDSASITKKTLVELEKKIYRNEQYSRRDSLEIVGIDESVETCDLEKKVIDILEDVNVVTNSKEIQACHRLWDGKRVICKFVNRKTVFNSISKRKLLGSLEEYKNKIYINESLCPYYRYLYSKCKGLWKNGKIHGFWVSNGSIRYRLQENGNFAKVEHIDDLEKVFGESCL